MTLAAGPLRQTEIKQLEALLRHQNIGGLEIAMGKTLAVRGVEGFQNLSGICDRRFRRQRAGERKPVDQFHHQIVRPDVMDLADIRMIESRNGPRFAVKPRGESVLRNLQGNIAVQPGVARFPHFPHPAAANG